MRSIRQSVQNGHFLCRLAQNALDLLVASRADKRIERLLVHVVATARPIRPQLPLAGYVAAMRNAFGVILDDASIRRAAVEGVPETVIAAIYLLHERSVDAVASKLTPDELLHVIRLVGRCPSCYPPGTLDALKHRLQTPAPQPPSVSASTDLMSRGGTRASMAVPMRSDSSAGRARLRPPCRSRASRSFFTSRFFSH